MMSWILIVMAVGVYKGGPATIPGYSTKDACEQAGRAFLESKIVGSGTMEPAGYVCIPGPPLRA